MDSRLNLRSEGLKWWETGGSVPRGLAGLKPLYSRTERWLAVDMTLKATNPLGSEFQEMPNLIDKSPMLSRSLDGCLTDHEPDKQFKRYGSNEGRYLTYSSSNDPERDMERRTLHNRSWELKIPNIPY